MDVHTGEDGSEDVSDTFLSLKVIFLFAGIEDPGGSSQHNAYQYGVSNHHPPYALEIACQFLIGHVLFAIASSLLQQMTRIYFVTI